MARWFTRKWLKFGCLGCTGLLAIVLLVLGILLLTARIQVRDAQPYTEIGTLEPAPAPGNPQATVPLILELDILDADLGLIPEEPGESLSITATYDPRRYLWEESEDAGNGRERIHRIRIAPLGNRTLALLHPVVGGKHPRVEIRVPPGLPFGIRGSFSGGLSWFDLENLWLTEAVLTTRGGLMQFRVRKPTARPVENLEFDLRGGNLVLYGIGNASPRRLDIHQGLGPGFLDLTGDWQVDSEVRLSVSFGHGEVRLPDRVHIRGLERQFAAYNREYRAGPDDLVPPILTMDVHFDAGDISMAVVEEIE